MIRFQPDTWRDALWRPVAMAAPDAGVYVEIMAPDVRFAALLALTLVSAVLALRRGDRPGPLTLLLAFAWLAFVPWLATTGNGRYFMPILLLAGPLCVALIYRLPASRNARIALCVILVAVQALAVAGSDPRRRWALMSWGESYFDVQLTAVERHEPAAWVLLTSLSYSLVAPQFDPRSRWMNVSPLRSDLVDTPDTRRATRFLDTAVRDGLPLRLLLPTHADHMDGDGRPSAVFRREIDRVLSPHRLALDGTCQTRPSRSMGLQRGGGSQDFTPERMARTGFWVCPLRYPVMPLPVAPPTPQALDAAQVFELLEQQCPRLFPPGGGRTARLPDGFLRDYTDSDTKAYAMDDGEVRFKYWRALNPNRIGRREEVLADGFRMDCHQVRGRSGLPWERRL